jgi:hypothetical protein
MTIEQTLGGNVRIPFLALKPVVNRVNFHPTLCEDPEVTNMKNTA